MNLVSVSGACSRSGKTALAATLLRALPPGAAAVKFTTTDDVFERCPRGTVCVVCDIAVPYRIIDDSRLLDEAGTDTARLREAGAGRVLWAIAKRSAVSNAWEAVRARVSPDATVVMEGSTIVGPSHPALCLFVVHPFLSPERWKETSSVLLGRADAVVVNTPRGDERAPSPAVLEEIARFRDRDDVRRADVTRPLAEWAPDLDARLRSLGRGATSRLSA